MKKYIPLILVLLFTSTLYMTYFTSDVVSFQIVIYLLILLCYIFSTKCVLRKANAVYMLLSALSLCYLIRAFIDIEILDVEQKLYGNDLSVFFFMLNGIVLPTIIVPRLKLAASYNNTFLMLSVVLVFSLFMTFSNFMQGKIYMSEDHRVMANEFLSVIQFGHLGLTAVILGVYFLMKRQERNLFILLSGALLFLGVVSMFLAGTRSAIIAAFFIAALYMLAKAKFKLLFILTVILVSLYLFKDHITSFFDQFGINSVNRIFAFFEEGGDQSSGRTILWQKASSDLSENLLLGVSCFFKYEDINFVHNSIIEITYALGLFGGLSFVYINWIAIKTCIMEFKGNNIDNKCFAFLYIQYFVYSMFSESIIRLSLYWFFLSIIIGMKVKKKYSLNEKRFSCNTNV